MKRILTALLLLCSWPAWGATWYATSSSANTNATGLWVPTSTGSCTGSGTALVWGAQANGDVFDANGCTALAVNVDPGVATGASAGVCGTVTVTTTLTTDATNGGAFTYATATNIVIHASVTATKTTALTISGSTNGGTICGNLMGGSTSNQYAIQDTHTSVLMYLVGNSSAGSADDAVGLNSTGTSGGWNVTGNCIGSTTGNYLSVGCAGVGAPSITLAGNIINGLRGGGVSGLIYLTPASTNYIISPKDASYTLGVVNSHATVTPTDPGASNVLSGVTYGPFTGTLSSSGGVCATSNW